MKRANYNQAISILLVIVSILFSRVSCNGSKTNYELQVCGGENLCNGGNKSSLPVDSCCRPCECERTCQEKGTCCRDWVTDNSNNVPNQQCLSSDRSSSVGDWYFVRAMCPEDYINESIRHQCETAKPSSLSDLPFVSSADGKIIYKNRYCAVCYGDDENAVTWDIMTDLSCMRRVYKAMPPGGSTPELDGAVIETTLIDKCVLQYIRPNITDQTVTICHDESLLIRTCNDRHRYNSNAIEEIEERCLNDKSPFIVFNPMVYRRVYANMYCFLCQSRYEMTKCSFLNDRKTIPRSLSFFLDMKALKERSSMTYQCKNSQMYDTYFGKCRDVVCSILEIPVNGRCRSVVASSYLNFNFDFQIELQSSGIWNRNNISVIIESIYKKLPTALGFHGCLTCGARFTAPKSQINTRISSLMMQYIVTTSAKCEFDRVLSLAEALEFKVKEGTEETVVINGIQMLVKYMWSRDEVREITKISQHIDSMNIIECKCLPANRFDNCPKVKLSRDEYAEIAARNQSLARYQMYVDAQDIIHLCLQDYEDMTTISSAGNILTEQLVTYITFVATLLLILMYLRF